MNYRNGKIAFILYTIILTGCGGFSTCDCFDDPDYAYSISINLKSYNTGIHIDTFLKQLDITGNPLNYSLKVYNTDSTFIVNRFDKWSPTNDSIIYCTVWDAPQKIEFSIKSAGLNHTLSDFKTEGYYKGSRNCKCFNPTGKYVRIDDSATIDVYHSGIYFKK